MKIQRREMVRLLTNAGIAKYITGDCETFVGDQMDNEPEMWGEDETRIRDFVKFHHDVITNIERRIYVAIRNLAEFELDSSTYEPNGSRVESFEV